MFIEDADDFWAKLAKLRKTHDRKMKRKTPKSKVYAQLGKVAKGDPKELSEAKLKDLTKFWDSSNCLIHLLPCLMRLNQQGAFPCAPTGLNM